VIGVPPPRAQVGSPTSRLTGGVGLLLAPLLLLAIWAALVALLDLPSYILPPPLQVARLMVAKSNLLIAATTWTAIEAVLGFALGCTLALVFAVLAVLSQRLRSILEPVMVFSQSFPLQAVAPLLVIWFGFGILPKVLASALICFFPLAMAAIRGMLHVDWQLEAVVLLQGATPSQTMVKLRLPAALPEIAAALKVCATLSVIGAVIGEFVSPQRGLGYVIRVAQSRVQTDLMFAALILLALLGVSLYALALYLENRLLVRRRLERRFL